MVAWLVPIAVFGSFVLMMGQLTRLLANISLNRTLREALRAHPQSVPLLADRLEARQPWADALIGWIFIAIAIGLALMSMFEVADDRREILQAAILPLTVGVLVLGFVYWAKSAADGDGARSAPPAPPVAPTAPVPPVASSAPRPPRRPRANRTTGS